ncbi:helix-turn-helix transcriptional regulator [Neobacillus sp. SuZ13]|uniref:helix-turn-helix domain-containing protein n=1 Tax=Neobacillus sp. SuZ13 TaxID=3047875 RepID=UPI0024BF6F0F|nr:helix-turn-helix transcriptional regulator [Neobacillus sp. SuZ13]WHY64707.1 helix-turn-helix transcriptional regulator [Neobacillus sp. SuZ13]
MNEEMREQYLLIRRRKKIKHIDIAKYIGCTQAMISYFELGKRSMSPDKVDMYKEFIDAK